MTDPIQGIGAISGAQHINDISKSSSASSSTSFQDVLEAGDAQSLQELDPVTTVEQPVAVEKSSASEQLDRFVSDVMNDERQIKSMMDRCSKGESLSQHELLQLQSVIYGYAQKVDLASKVVDKATGGIKQVMNTQV